MAQSREPLDYASPPIEGEGMRLHPIERRISESLIIWFAFIVAGALGAISTVRPFILIAGQGDITFAHDNEFLFFGLCIYLFFGSTVFLLVTIVRSWGRVWKKNAEQFDTRHVMTAAVLGFAAIFLLPWYEHAVTGLGWRLASHPIVAIVIWPSIFAEVYCWLAIRRQKPRCNADVKYAKN